MQETFKGDFQPKWLEVDQLSEIEQWVLANLVSCCKATGKVCISSSKALPGWAEYCFGELAPKNLPDEWKEYRPDPTSQVRNQLRRLRPEGYAVRVQRGVYSPSPEMTDVQIAYLEKVLHKYD